jgi:uncharacterized protein YndB with AHSA1/START domain
MRRLKGERMPADIDIADPVDDRILVLTRTLDAPRELVFRVWTRTEHLSQWLGPRDFTIPFCEADFRVGGEYRFCMRSPEGEDHWAWGVYREIDEPERIVFTWNRDDIDGRPRRDSLVTVTFADSGGKTLLMLRHSDFGTTWDRDEHETGWTQCMDRLAAYVAITRGEAI